MESFIGEVRLMPLSYDPEGWKICQGQTLYVRDFQALYSIIGNVYGGVSGQTFCLPNFGGLAIAGAGTGIGLTPRAISKQYWGEVEVSVQGLPTHQHTFTARMPAAVTDLISIPVAGCYVSRTNAQFDYVAETQDSNSLVHLAPTGPAGSLVAAPHKNTQPYLAMGYFICHAGVYPLRD